jgi:hypothetical protein
MNLHGKARPPTPASPRDHFKTTDHREDHGGRTAKIYRDTIACQYKL